MQTTEELAPASGDRPDVRRTRAPARQPVPPPASAPGAPARALSEPERQEVLQLLHSERFVDAAPAQVHATLLEEGSYLCSTRSMYRILAAAARSGSGATSSSTALRQT